MPSPQPVLRFQQEEDGAAGFNFDDTAEGGEDVNFGSADEPIMRSSTAVPVPVVPQQKLVEEDEAEQPSALPTTPPPTIEEKESSWDF